VKKRQSNQLIARTVSTTSKYPYPAHLFPLVIFPFNVSIKASPQTSPLLMSERDIAF